VNAFAEILYAEKIIPFSGRVKYFEYKLAYVSPNNVFSELARLNNVISKNAGHNRYFKGIAFVNISEWLKYSTDKHFNEFLRYIASKNDEILTIFYVNSDNVLDVESMESSLSTFMRIETTQIRLPSAEQLLVFMEKHLNNQDFHLKDDAKMLIKNSIQEIINSKNFRGIATVKQLAESIAYDVLTTNVEDKQISAEMLNGFTEYVRRLQRTSGRTSNIGFNTSK
jgi:hypothetical protein